MVEGSDNREETLVLLDVDVPNFGDGLEHVLFGLANERDISGEQLEKVRRALVRHEDLGPSEHRNGVALVHCRVRGIEKPHQVLVRFRDAIDTHPSEPPTWFMWVLLCSEQTHPHMDTAAEFAQLLEDPDFQKRAIEAPDPDALQQAYLNALSQHVHPSEHPIPPELQRTGRLFGGIVEDIKRRLPTYGADFKDGLNGKTLASVFFLFFACLAPAVAFGGLLSVLTDGSIGAIEMIVATTVCGVVYALTSGQPLTILGSTGPVIIFMGILYAL